MKLSEMTDESLSRYRPSDEEPEYDRAERLREARTEREIEEREGEA